MGTITDKDFYSMLAERYVPANTPDYFARYREGRISHFEAMAAYFAFAGRGLVVEKLDPSSLLVRAGLRFAWGFLDEAVRARGGISAILALE